MNPDSSPEAKRRPGGLLRAWGVFGAVALGWFLLELLYAAGTGPPPDTRRVVLALLGVVLWGLGLALTWAFFTGRCARTSFLLAAGGLGALVGLRLLAAGSFAACAAGVSGLLLGGTVVALRRGTPGAGYPLLLAAPMGVMSSAWLRAYVGWFEVETAAAVPVTLAAGFLLLAPGSWIADRVLGRTRTVFVILAAAGFFLVAGVMVWRGAVCSGGGRLDRIRGLDSRPNVLMISVDTLRQDRVPPYGGPATPAFDRLAEDSRLYTNLFSTSGWTLPAHGSLFTGALPVRHGAVTQESTIDSGLRSFTEDLKRSGYATAAFTDGGYLHPEYGFDRGFETFRHYPFEGDTEPLGVGGDFEPGALSAVRRMVGGPRRVDTGGFAGGSLRSFPSRRRYFGRIVDRAARWIRAEGRGCRPFFVFLHTFQVHDWDRRWGQGYPKNRRRLRKEHPRLARTVLKPDEVEPPPPWERDPPPGLRERAHRNLRRLPVENHRAVRERLEGLDSDTRAVLYRWLVLHSDTPWRKFLGTVLSGDTEMPPLPYPSFGNRKIHYTVLHKWLYAWGDGSRYHDPFQEDPWGVLQELEGLSDTEARRLRSLTRRQLQAYERLYDYGIEDVDAELGRLLRFLRRRDLYEDTLIVLLSDHGEGFSQDPLVIRHGNPANRGVGQLHDVLLEVPFWLKPAGGDGGSRTVSTPLSITDVFPLLFERLGLERPDRVSGFPGGARGRRWLLGSTVEGRTYRSMFPQTFRLFVRGDGYKLLLRPGLGGPTRRAYWSVGDTPSHPERPREERTISPEVREDLQHRMGRYLEDFHRMQDTAAPRGSPMSPEVRRQLRGLGYVQ